MNRSDKRSFYHSISVPPTLSSRVHRSPPAEGKVWERRSRLLATCSLSKSQNASAEQKRSDCVSFIFIGTHRSSGSLQT